MSNFHTVIKKPSRLHKLLHKNTTGQNLQRLEKPIQLNFCHVTRNLLYRIFNQFIFQFLNCLYPFWAWHEIYSILSILSRWADSQFVFSNLWSISPNGRNGLIPNSEFWTLYFQSEFGFISPNGRNEMIPNSEFWTTLFSVQFMSYQSKWLIQWDCSKKIRLLKLEVI